MLEDFGGTIGRRGDEFRSLLLDIASFIKNLELKSFSPSDLTVLLSSGSSSGECMDKVIVVTRFY